MKINWDKPFDSECEMDKIIRFRIVLLKAMEIPFHVIFGREMNVYERVMGKWVKK